MSTAAAQPVAARPRSAGRTGLMVALGLGILVVLIVITVVISWLLGSGPEMLVTRYGRGQQPGESGSVNGTDVLAAMFSEQGHSIYHRRSILSSEMEAVDTVVWFPNDFEPPSEELCFWFDEWLAAAPGRTLVYVGRDFNATPLYWEYLAERQAGEKPASDSTSKTGSDKLAQEMTRAASEDQPRESDGDEEESESDDDYPSCEWFYYQEEPLDKATELRGPWMQGVDAAKADVWLGDRLYADGDLETLLAAGDDAIVERLNWPYWEGSQLLLVANGSFLLNLPLVNHENRKLAGQLIAAATPRGRVVFLESGPGGPSIDPEGLDRSLWTLLGAWPLNVILLQLAAVGVIFCFARWPIFGRPKQPPGEVTADFSKHVAAVGRLLYRTGNRQFLAQRSAAEEKSSAAHSTRKISGGRPHDRPPSSTKGS